MTNPTPPNLDTPASAEPRKFDTSVFGPKPSPVQQAIQQAREAVKGGKLDLKGTPWAPTSDGVADGGVRGAQEQAAATSESTTADTEELPPTVVELPVTDAEGRPIQLDVEDVETAAAVRAVADGALLRDQYHELVAEVDEAAAGIEHFQYLVAHHPDALVARFVRGDPERAARLARGLLALPGVRELADSDVREDTEILASMSAVERQADETVRVQGMARRYSQSVTAALDRLTAKLPGDAAALASSDIRRDIADMVRQNGGPIPLAELPNLLAGRLAQYGLDPAAVAHAFASDARPPIRRRDAQSVEDARATGARLAAASAARRAATAIPGAGAGARATKLEPPSAQGVTDRIKWVRQKLGL